MMTAMSEAQKRIDFLRTELENDIKFELKFARLDHWISIGLMLVALLASGVAGIGGLAEFLTVKQTGAIALLPGIIAVIGSTLKFEGKSGWHYRKKNRLGDLKDQLILQLPESPTLDQIAALSKKRNGLIKDMQAEWEHEFPLIWSSLQKSLKIEAK